MASLQATWMPSGHLFFWASEGSAAEAIAAELPALRWLGPQADRRPLVHPHPRPRRVQTDGVLLEVGEVAPLLARLPSGSQWSDSLAAWCLTARLGLELAAGQRVVPTVAEGKARWRALLARGQDQERLERLAQALPPAGRAVATGERGPVRLQPAVEVVQDFLDVLVDHLYRSRAWPGSSRGWPRELANALRGEEDAFAPRFARDQSVPRDLAAWSQGVGRSRLKAHLVLSLPPGGDPVFPLALEVSLSDRPSSRISASEAWSAGDCLHLDGQEVPHPALALLRALARARQMFAPLRRALSGPAPQDLLLDVHQAWQLFSEARPELEAAGVRVVLPQEFAASGVQRLRARLRILAPDAPLHEVEVLEGRWEVALGDRVLSGSELSALTERREPIVLYQGSWILLDPAEVAKLPEGVDAVTRLPLGEALLAVLTGIHKGAPVLPDEPLEDLLGSLREPPEVDAPENFQGALRPYQQRGLAWLTTLGRLGLGACLADDMGLGKTVQVIAYLLRRRELNLGSTLIICPTSLLANWTAELATFGPSLSVARHHGPTRDFEAARDHDVVLTTYGVLTRDEDLLADHPWDVVVLDEAQAIKNPSSERARTARRLRARHRLALSGTPVENRLEELWSLFEFLIPGMLGTLGTFRREVSLPVERFGDTAVAERLKQGVSPFLLRRLKSDPTIAPDLPEKIERKVFSGLTAEQASLYREVAEDHLQRIAESELKSRRGLVLAMLTALKQVCNHPSQYLKDDGPLGGRSGKLDSFDRLLDRVLPGGERVLVFTQYRAMGERLQAHLARRHRVEAPFLHGGASPSQREAMVQAFQEDDDAPPLLIISLRAGGTGLNLTRATHVVHYDRWWNPAVEDQATDRAYRIGQRENVLVHKLIASDTLEDRIDALLEAKRALADQVVSAGETWISELDDTDLRRLVALSQDGDAP